jgi:PAS domain S-box-containing protein
MPDSLVNTIASGAAFTAVAAAAGALGDYLFRLWRTRHADRLADRAADAAEKKDAYDSLKGYADRLEAKVERLNRENQEIEDRTRAEVAALSDHLMRMEVQAEAYRGELRMAQAALTQLRAGLAPLAVADIQYTVIYADQDCNILEVTPLVTALFHYFARELIGRNVKALIPERYHAAHDEGIRRVIASGKLSIDGKSIPMFALTKEQDEIPINLALSGWYSRGKWIFMATITSRHEDDPFAPRPPLSKPPVPTADAAPVVAAIPVVSPAVAGLNPRTEVTP